MSKEQTPITTDILHLILDETNLRRDFAEDLAEKIELHFNAKVLEALERERIFNEYEPTERRGNEIYHTQTDEEMQDLADMHIKSFENDEYSTTHLDSWDGRRCLISFALKYGIEVRKKCIELNTTKQK